MFPLRHWDLSLGLKSYLLFDLKWVPGLVLGIS